MRGDQHAMVVDLHQPGLHHHFDRLAGQPHPARYVTDPNPIVPFDDTRRVACGPRLPALSLSRVVGAGWGVSAVMVRSSKRRIGATFPID